MERIGGGQKALSACTGPKTMEKDNKGAPNNALQTDAPYRHDSCMGKSRAGKARR